MPEAAPGRGGTALHAPWNRWTGWKRTMGSCRRHGVRTTWAGPVGERRAEGRIDHALVGGGLPDGHSRIARSAELADVRDPAL
jgi:hypothetical protein